MYLDPKKRSSFDVLFISGLLPPCPADSRPSNLQEWHATSGGCYLIMHSLFRLAKRQSKTEAPTRGEPAKRNARSHMSVASRSSNLIRYETYSRFSALCCQLVSCGRLSVPPCPCGDGVVRAIQVSVHLPKSRQTRSPPWRRRNCASTAGYTCPRSFASQGTHPIHNPPLACSID